MGDALVRGAGAAGLVKDTDYVQILVDPDRPHLREIVFHGCSLLVVNSDLLNAADEESAYADRASPKWAEARNEVCIAWIEQSVGRRLRPMEIN